MRSMVFPACVVAVGLSIAFPAMPADPAPPAGEAKAENIPAGNAPITFEQYRAWRLAAMERRLSEIDMQLGAPDLSRRAQGPTRGDPRLLQMAGRAAGGGAGQAFPRALRSHRRQSRRRRRCRRARRLAGAAAGLLRRRGQGRDRASRRARRSRTGKQRGREKGRGRAARPRQIGSPLFAAFLLQKDRRRRVMLSCTHPQRAMQGSPT